MLYYLSKIFWFCAQPSGLLLILLVGGAVLLRTRYRKTGERLVLVSAALLFFGGLLPLSNWLILPLEERFPRADLSGQHVDGIIILGGVESPRVSMARNAHAINEAAERLTETAALTRQFPEAKIVFTGASIGIFNASTAGADVVKSALLDLGIEETNRLVFENNAHNTWENALYTKALMKPKPSERWLLVTSAWHMPRA
ncbi:MAG: YdcF family protein, partial [Hyphomicrobium sp.]